jgi:hypothetical protein
LCLEPSSGATTPGHSRQRAPKSWVHIH